jgi:hypothetical protein
MSFHFVDDFESLLQRYEKVWNNVRFAPPFYIYRVKVDGNFCRSVGFTLSKYIN